MPDASVLALVALAYVLIAAVGVLVLLAHGRVWGRKATTGADVSTSGRGGRRNFGLGLDQARNRLRDNAALAMTPAGGGGAPGIRVDYARPEVPLTAAQRAEIARIYDAPLAHGN